MDRSKIQQAFDFGWEGYCISCNPSGIQRKAAKSIMLCKSGALGYNVSICGDCGYEQIHNNSCRNRNCPNCQAILKEIWIDKRRSEVIDAPYFHVVFTVPAELNSLIYANQKLLYSLLHRCAAGTLLELSADRKYLGATPGVIQVLHTWGQELNYHPHVHCIVSGGGLSPDGTLKTCGKGFFIPAKVLAAKFKGKFLAGLRSLHDAGTLGFSASCQKLRNSYEWKEFMDSLYEKQWCPDIRETFNGRGNAIEYLGRYANRIAITNTRIKSVTDECVVFTAKDYKNGSVTKEVSVPCSEFIRRLMMHVLPKGFQKIRYYGFLSNSCKSKNLDRIFRLQGHRRFVAMLDELAMDEVLKKVWGYDIHVCPVCKGSNLHLARRVFPLLC